MGNQVQKGFGGQGVLGGVAEVVGSAFGYCARLTTGGVACWGNNKYGALGFASTASTSTTPVRVVDVDGSGALGNVARLVRAGYTTCAVLTSSGLDCWGGQSITLLGAPAGHLASIPFHVPGVGGAGVLDGVVKVTLMGSTICVVLTSTGVDCWGSNVYGVLGAGSEDAQSTTPVAVVGIGGAGVLSGAAEVVGDGRFACARLVDGGAACWGSGNTGQLSGPLPPSLRSAAPRAVVGVGGSGTLAGVTELSVNFDSVCAVLTSTGVVCWGSNRLGQLGNGSNVNGVDDCTIPCALTPTSVKAIGGGTGTLARVAHATSDSTNAVGGAGYYAVLNTGGVDFWGGGTNSQGLFGTYNFLDFARYSLPAAA